MYLVVDEGRMNDIKRTFEEYCKDDFTLEKEERQTTKQPEGFMDWSLFTVKNKKGNAVATFNPNGTFELLDRKFKKIFNQMVNAIEEVAEKKTKEVRQMELRERAEMHGFDPTFYDKEREENEK